MVESPSDSAPALPGPLDLLRSTDDLLLSPVVLGALMDRNPLPPHPVSTELGPAWSVLGYLLDDSFTMSTADRAQFLLGYALSDDPARFAGVLAALRDSTWQMTVAERAVIALIAACLRPTVAIDAGTYRGGSAAGLSKLCQRVVTIDWSPDRAAFVDELENVEFRCGTAAEVVGRTLDELPETQLIVLDADHTAEGIVAEVRAVIDHPAPAIRALIIHDTAMDTCREGLDGIRWSDHPRVRGATTDLLPGTPNELGEMTGGLGLMWLLDPD